MSRGGWRGGGRPSKPVGEKREHIGCRIKADNRSWLLTERERSGHSIGELVDFAVEILQQHPEKFSPNAEPVQDSRSK